jgi:hypothetical protein
LYIGISFWRNVVGIETLKTAIVSVLEEPSASFFRIEVVGFYHFCAVLYPEYPNETLRAVEQWVGEMH